MKFTLYTANCTGNEKNILYPYCVDVTNEDILKSAVQSDHVSAKFSGYKRSNANFIESDCLMFDCDNSHSENSEDWVTPLELALTFPEVAFAAVYSRNHMKPKGTKAPRPKFHVYFAAEKGMSVTERQNLKKQVLEQFPYFDEKALDEAHFFFGVEHPKVEWYQGNLTLAEFFEKDAFAEWDAQMDGIPEGSRNSTMSRIAGKLVKRYGATEEAYQRFLKTAETCNPPLSDTELQQIWKSAERFGTQIAKAERLYRTGALRAAVPVPPRGLLRPRTSKDFCRTGARRTCLHRCNGILMLSEKSLGRIQTAGGRQMRSVSG